MAVLDPFYPIPNQKCQKRGTQTDNTNSFLIFSKTSNANFDSGNVFSLQKDFDSSLQGQKSPPPSLEIQFYFAKYQFLYPARIRFLLKT